jgi:hypothetical protein
MPRPVAIRASYRNDAAFLLRLEEAIGKDPAMRDAWKRTGAKLIRPLVHHLLTAEKERVRVRPAKSAVDAQKQANE